VWGRQGDGMGKKNREKKKGILSVTKKSRGETPKTPTMKLGVHRNKKSFQRKEKKKGNIKEGKGGKPQRMIKGRVLAKEK